MVSYSKVFSLILANSLLSFFVTVPCFVYKANNIARKYYFVIPATVLMGALVYNFLILIDYEAIAFSLTPVFFVLLFSPVFLEKSTVKNNDGKDLERMGVLMFFIVLLFTVAAFFLGKLIAGIPHLFSVYFALFTMVYQIPGFLYCKNRLRRRQKSINLSQLTKREKEVVTEICSGLKYEEIADKLFISLSAVKKHTYNIYRKLEIKNNRELMLLVNNAKEQ
jgi:DNA-binding CsgD family transcriptional regulator